MYTMQASTRTKGPCQAERLQSTFNQTTRRNRRRDRFSVLSPPNENGMGVQFGHFKIPKQVSTQRQDTGLSVNHKDYPNSTQNTIIHYRPTANMNTGFRQQVMSGEKTPMPGNLQSFSINNYEPQGMQQNLNQNLISKTEKVSTSPSTMQAVYIIQQHSPVQNHIYNQSYQQTAHALPSYSESVSKNVHGRSSQGPSAQVQGYTVNEQTNYSAPQTNYKCAVQTRNAPFHTNNTSILVKTFTGVPGQTHYNSYPNQQHMQQPIVGGNGNVQIAQQVINTNCKVSSMQLQSPTCILENYDLLPLDKNPAPPQTAQNMPMQNHSANSSLSTRMIYLKMNDVPSVNLPLTQTFPANRSEASEKSDTVSSSQASYDTSLTSISHAQRAVAVVLPLSQEDSRSKLSPNSSSDPCFASDDKLMKNVNLNNPSLKKIQMINGVPLENTIVIKKHPRLTSHLMTLDDATPNLSSLPLTFSQLVKGTIPQNWKISGQRNDKLGNSKTPTTKKPSEESPSSLPITEWTLKSLTEKISEMEKENKKSEIEHQPCEQMLIKLLLVLFWNGSLTTILEAVKLKKHLYTSEFTGLCKSVEQDTVVLSHMESQIDLNRYLVLQHGEVYEEEVPYSSTWLNINYQLDDIDKEFGFPYFLKLSQHECADNKDTEIQCGQKENVQTGVKTVQPEEPKTQNDKSDQNLTCVDSGSDNTDEEITALLQSETNSHKDSDKNKCESNEQASDLSYSFKIEVLSPEKAKVVFEQMNHNSKPENMEPSTSETTAPNDQNGSKKQTCNPTTIETVCCIDKWKEKVLGLTSEKKCECKMVPNQNKEPESLNTDNSGSMEIFDLTEDDSIISVVPLLEPEGVIVLSESDDEIKVSEENQTPRSNPTKEQDFKTTETSLIRSPDKNTLQTSIERESEVTMNETICEIKEQGDDCKRGEGETVEEEEKRDVQNSISSPHLRLNDSVQKHVKKTKMETSDAALFDPSKKLSSHLRSQTILESFSKLKNTEPTTRVELALFGSGTRQYNSLSLQEQPPEKLYFKMDSSTTGDSQEEAKSLSKISVKRKLHEKWRKSFPFTTIKIRKYDKEFAIVGATPVRRKGVNSKRKVNDFDGLCRKKRRTLTASESENLLHKPDDTEEKALHKNVLNLKVLPSSFSLEEGSKNDDSAMDSSMRIPFLKKQKDKNTGNVA